MAGANFTQELTLLVFDKLFLALVVIFVGYFLNRALERYRTHQAIREAIETERLSIVTPLWNELNALQYVITQYSLKGFIAKEEELEQLKKDIVDGEDRAILNARAARFWLGSELFDKHQEYLNRIRVLADRIEDFQEALKSGEDLEAKGEAAKESTKHAAGAFLYIDDVLEF